jgi:hypothetical protein
MGLLAQVVPLGYRVVPVACQNQRGSPAKAQEYGVSKRPGIPHRSQGHSPATKELGMTDHKKTIEALAVDDWWLIYFEDAGVPPVLFRTEDAARAYYRDRHANWNCHLFRKVDSNHSDAELPKGPLP